MSNPRKQQQNSGIQLIVHHFQFVIVLYILKIYEEHKLRQRITTEHILCAYHINISIYCAFEALEKWNIYFKNRMNEDKNKLRAKFYGCFSCFTSSSDQMTLRDLK